MANATVNSQLLVKKKKLSSGEINQQKEKEKGKMRAGL